MPKICEFFGIAIYVYYREHQPAHFHAIYAGDEVLVDIETLSVLRGKLPPRAMGLVIEWATLYKDELKIVWERAVKHRSLGKIDPLE
jgi:hypothetical protein